MSREVQVVRTQGNSSTHNGGCRDRRVRTEVARLRLEGHKVDSRGCNECTGDIHEGLGAKEEGQVEMEDVVNGRVNQEVTTFKWWDSGVQGTGQVMSECMLMNHMVSREMTRSWASGRWVNSRWRM